MLVTPNRYGTLICLTVRVSVQKCFNIVPTGQCFGSRSGLDPDSIRSVDPDSGSGSKRAKMIHKNRKKVKKFHDVLKCWMFSFEG